MVVRLARVGPALCPLAVSVYMFVLVCVGARLWSELLLMCEYNFVHPPCVHISHYDCDPTTTVPADAYCVIVPTDVQL
jgi:hypothetical protein